MPPRKRLGQLLTELGVIDEHQLQSALGHQKQWGGKLGAILVQKGFCNEDQMVSALTQHLTIPRVKLAEAKIDPRAQKCVSRQIAEKLHVFPYELSGSGRSEVVTVAMSDPTDLSAVDQLAFHTGKRIKPMLAGDSEVLNAIHAHYAAPEEKKEPTDKVGQQKATGPVAAAGTLPRRIDSPPPVAPAPRPSPYIPPPIPQARPSSRPGELEEIEPDEVMAPPADTPRPAPASLDLPEAEAEAMGLEPIAAHSQSGEPVSGDEEASGQGSAADAVEGLVPDAVGNVAAEAEGWQQGLQTAQPESAWGAPAQADAPGWGETSEDVPVDDAGWGTDAEAQPADVVGEALPTDAILGAAAGTAAPGTEPTGWGTATVEEAPVAGAVVEEVPVELNGDEEPAGAPVGETPAAEAGPAMEPEEVAYEAEAPDAWASSDDPLAAQGADVPAWGDVPREDSADHAAGPGATQEFANPIDQAADAQGEPEPAKEHAAEEPAAEWGREGEAPVEEAAAVELPLEDAPAEELQFEETPPEERVEESPQEELSAGEPQPEAEESGEYAEQGEEAGLQLEGWAAPPEEPEPQGTGWVGEALEASAPLAPADLDALSSVGLDPNDGVGALRLLAALVRILQRRQLIDPEELAAEIRESRAQGAAAAAEQSGAYEDAPESDQPAADPGSAET
ncbi:MAG: hypothetical protein ACM3PC_11825 [Deltaproteobacteria bacterium]